MNRLIILAIVTVIQSAAQGIIDFSHSDSIEKTATAQRQSYQLNIFPDKKTDYLLFPQACNLSQGLDFKSALEVQDSFLAKQERELNGLKGQVKQLLKLSEEIKTAKRNLQRPDDKAVQAQLKEIQHYAEGQFVELEQMEADLRAVNQTISNMTLGLKKLISHEIDRTKESTFDEIRLTFELKISQARLIYLEEAKKSSSGRPSSSFDPLIKSLFGDISEEIVKENRELVRLDELLGRFTERQEIKLRISLLQDERDATDLMIKEKEECDNRRRQMFDHEDKKQLEKIIRDLKNLKRDQTKNSQFCDGVTIALQKQIKKVLRIYNYSYACLQGLKSLRQSRNNITIELQKLIKAESDIHYDETSDKIKNYFKRQENMRNHLLNQIKTIKLSEHGLDITMIDAEIKQLKERIKKLKHQLENPPQSHGTKMDFEQIRSMISDIEVKQNEYCNIREQYLRKYRSHDVKMRSLEHQISGVKKIQNEKMEQANLLRELEGKFEALRSVILSSIQ